MLMFTGCLPMRNTLPNPVFLVLVRLRRSRTVTAVPFVRSAAMAPSVGRVKGSRFSYRHFAIECDRAWSRGCHFVVAGSGLPPRELPNPIFQPSSLRHRPDLSQVLRPGRRYLVAIAPAELHQRQESPGVFGLRVPRAHNVSSLW